MKQEKKRLETIGRIEWAFLELYRTKDISKITVKEITDSAGVYRSTFYLYFQDVFAVLEVIENDILEDCQRFVLSLGENGDMETLFSVMLSLYEKHGESVAILLGKNGDAVFVQKVKQTVYPFINEALGCSEGDTLSGLKTEFYISGALAVITKWYCGEYDIPPQQLLSFLRSQIE